MSWIQTVPPDQAAGRLRSLYDRVAGPEGKVDNILQVHGLRPHTLEGHMSLYKAVLHHSANRLPEWLLETLGIHVSRLNGCAYCTDHHYAGLERLTDADTAAAILAGLDHHAGVPPSREEPTDTGPLDARAHAAISYATRLTREPAAVTADDVEMLRAAGLDDGEILEINQVVGYFAYANRTVQGLGVDTKGDSLGLSPASTGSADDWRHG